MKLKEYVMSAEWAVNIIAVTALVATVVFILRAIDIPREWWMVVMGAIMAKLFKGSNGSK